MGSSRGKQLYISLERKMHDKKTTGRCLCGAVRYQTEAEAEWTWYCHCESCRRHTGAPVAMYVGFPEDKIEWLAGERALYEHTPGIFRGYCRDCGTPLTYEGLWRGKEIFEVHISTLDEPDKFPPSRHCFYNERIAWFDTSDDLRRDVTPQ